MFEIILSNNMVITFIVIITILSILEITYFFPKNRSVRSVIVTIGILSIFFATVHGLHNLDIRNQNSLQEFIEVLKGSFVTITYSVLMIIILSLLEKIGILPQDSNELKSNFFLGEIMKLHKEGNRKLTEISNNQSDMYARLEKLEALFDESNGKLDYLEEISLFQKHQDSKLVRLNTMIDQKLEGIRTILQNIEAVYRGSLQKVASLEARIAELIILIGKLLEESPKESIEKLDRDIIAFHSDMSALFGSNFSQLTKSVAKLIEWQDNYKSQIEMMEANIESAHRLMQKSEEAMSHAIINTTEIADILKDSNKNIKKLLPELNKLIEDIDANLQMTVNVVQNQFGDLIENLNTNIQPILENITKTTTEVFDTNSKLDKILTGNREQVEQIQSITKELQKQREDILAILNQQNQAIRQITLKFPEELKLFENSLVSLTENFLTSYETFLKNAKRLMDS